MSRDEQRLLVERGTILRGTVGSTVHGLHHGGQDDRDEMATFLEPPEFLIGLRLAQSGSSWGPFEHRRVNRPELIEAHGFDTKYAMHVARLGFQGVELLTTGRLTLPMAEPARSRVMAIRKGEVSLEETLAEIDEIERELQAAIESSPLRPEPDYDAVNAFVVESYRESWGWAG